MLWRFFITTSLFVAGDMPLVRKWRDSTDSPLTAICWGGCLVGCINYTDRWSRSKTAPSKVPKPVVFLPEYAN